MQDSMAREGIDYALCQYGTSRLIFRGPKRRLRPEAIAFVGGSETFGRFVERPFPALVEGMIDCPAVNFGCMNAGLSAFEEDETVIAACSDMQACILQTLDPQNMTNGYYSVHPRRNDRFIGASERLAALFPEADFTEYHFTRHLLATLAELDPQAFVEMAGGLATEWVARMRRLIRRIESPVILLWMEPADTAAARSIRISRRMVEAVAEEGVTIVEARPSGEAARSGDDGKIGAEGEPDAAGEMPGPLYHAEVARSLIEALAPHLAPQGRIRTRTRPSLVRVAGSGS